MTTQESGSAGLGELKISEFEKQNSPLSIFTTKKPDNYIEDGTEHIFSVRIQFFFLTEK